MNFDNYKCLSIVFICVYLFISIYLFCTFLSPIFSSAYSKWLSSVLCTHHCHLCGYVYTVGVTKRQLISINPIIHLSFQRLCSIATYRRYLFDQPKNHLKSVQREIITTFLYALRELLEHMETS